MYKGNELTLITCALTTVTTMHVQPCSHVSTSDYRFVPVRSKRAFFICLRMKLSIGSDFRACLRRLSQKRQGNKKMYEQRTVSPASHSRPKAMQEIGMAHATVVRSCTAGTLLRTASAARTQVLAWLETSVVGQCPESS